MLEEAALGAVFCVESENTAPFLWLPRWGLITDVHRVTEHHCWISVLSLVRSPLWIEICILILISVEYLLDFISVYSASS